MKLLWTRSVCLLFLMTCPFILKASAAFDILQHDDETYVVDCRNGIQGHLSYEIIDEGDVVEEYICYFRDTQIVGNQSAGKGVSVTQIDACFTTSEKSHEIMAEAICSVRDNVKKK